MIRFITHDQALMYNRMEKIFALCIFAGIASGILNIGLGMNNPIAILGTWIIAIVSQFMVLKFWLDMMFLSKPFKNCWEFKDD